MPKSLPRQTPQKNAADFGTAPSTTFNAQRRRRCIRACCRRSIGGDFDYYIPVVKIAIRRFFAAFAAPAFWAYFLILLISTSAICAEEAKVAERPARNVFSMFKLFGDSKFKLFPVPIFETSPGGGQRYGAMPTFLWLSPKPEEELIGILFSSFYYNSQAVKFGTFGGIFLYPSDHEEFNFFYELAQNFAEEYYVRYWNENWFDGKIDGEMVFQYLVDPFERFYGLGPDTNSGAKTNFVSENWHWRGRFAFEIFKDIDLQILELWKKTNIRTRAITTINDTLTTFGGNNEVRSSNQWVHRLSAKWDTRDSKIVPTVGHFVEPYFLFSHEPFQDDTFYYGYGLTGKKIFRHQERLATVVRFQVDQVFGTMVPFYMQPRLGGAEDLRAFVKRRFVGRGRFLFDVEERITIKKLKVTGVRFDLSVDPFFSVGQVLNRWGDVAFTNLQPVGGVGIRAIVPPSVVGRIDVGMGKEGLEVFTTLDYPF